MYIYPGCKVRPNYNRAGETKALYCVAHKLENMVDITPFLISNAHFEMRFIIII